MLSVSPERYFERRESEMMVASAAEGFWPQS